MAERNPAPHTAADLALIKRIIPHRYPFLMIDKVRDIVPYEGAVGIKCVTANEPHFPGHFPDQPIMPGVLIVEALAQAAGVLAVESLGLVGSGKLVYFMAIDEAKFRAPVEPGVLLRLEVEFVQKRERVCKFAGRALIDGKVAAQANFTAMIADPPKTA